MHGTASHTPSRPSFHLAFQDVASTSGFGWRHFRVHCLQSRTPFTAEDALVLHLRIQDPCFPNRPKEVASALSGLPMGQINQNPFPLLYFQFVIQFNFMVRIEYRQHALSLLWEKDP